ncbi:hypothetical protein [Bacillus sp. AFS053548]|uniref:hypothetical protein n=1 Tax=Bacillus sp. AFS053548 TaxID=2033505 RepID=UPI000BFD7920|nr:hypothetical protein [Bacillus sp. AFS053548]PGM59905.1 hypothetical protein CN946_00410 [Bacillus sp. AFS053548]
MKAEESLYIFNGHKFIEFIDVPTFKSSIFSKFKLPKDVKEYDFPKLYEYLVLTFPKQINEIGKIFFDNILYSHLKNIFIDKISSHPNLDTNSFKGNIKELIKDINHESTSVTFHKDMSEKGFYLMDVLNITKPDSTFLAGYDFEEKEGKVTNARFIFVEVVPIRNKITFFIAGIEIDFVKGNVLTMIRNINGLKKQSEETDTTIHQLHNSAINKVFLKLGIVIDEPNVEDDRKGMYNFCKNLDDLLLSDIRLEIDKRTKTEVDQSVKTFNNVLFNGDGSLSPTDKMDLGKKIKSLLLSYYMEQKIKSKDLVKKAKGLKMPGYPTRIKFTSSKLSKSSTQTSNAKHPVSASDMFHSLYFNFEQALGLDNWSISWFKDYKFLNDKDTDVIQTTIYSTKKQFRIVFLPSNPLNKEIIHYVIGTIDKKRKP